MTDHKNNFIRLKDELALTGEERAVMRSALVSRMSAQVAEITIPSPYLRFFMEPLVGPLRAVAAFALVLIVGAGGTSTLASDALPGDTLYAVKVSVNEKLERSFARTPGEKAVVDIKHAEERLAEVELLAAEGNADDKTVADASAAVEEKVGSAMALAATLSSEGDTTDADGIHTRLNATLLAHADILDAQAEDLDEERQRSLRSLSFAVTHALFDADEAREQVGKDYESAVVLGRETMVERRIHELERELKKQGVPEETVAELDIELAAIQEEYGDARKLSVDGDYDEAGAAYAQIGRRVSRALAIIQSARRIEDKTGKEVVVTFGTTEPVATTMIMAKSAAPVPETMMMTMVVEDTATTSEDVSAQRSYDRPFRFWVRDRSND